MEILQDWVTARMIKGQHIYTKEDVLSVYPYQTRL